MNPLQEASFHPPVLDAGGDVEEEIPSVLLEYNAYVADRRNETTAVADSSCGREVQVTFFAARPPRVSYLCVFCRAAATDEHKEMVVTEPEVLATDDNLVLLRIVVSPKRTLIICDDLYIYQPAGSDGPSLTRLPHHPGGVRLVPDHVGILSCAPNDDRGGSTLLRAHRPRQEKFYMVAALCHDESAIARGRYIIHVYNSKLQAWTATNVTLEDQHFKKYNVDDGYFLHINTRVIPVGGEDATIAFVDLWKGILLCDLSHIREKPWLRYVPLPETSGQRPHTLGDAYRSRDIAVVNGHFKFVRNWAEWKDCPTCGRGDGNSWRSTVWTRPVSASSLLDDSWQLVCDMDSSEMDVKSCPDFQLLPKLGDNYAFQRLDMFQPTLSWHSTDDTVWFVVKIKHLDARAWVIAVDMMNNRLQGVANFDAVRYAVTGYAYLHSRISKYLKRTPGAKENLKRQGGMLLKQPGKLPGIRKPMQHGAGMEEVGDDDMVLG